LTRGKAIFKWLSKNLIWIVLFTLHLPFIAADPFIPFDDSRAAFTDEGLYLFQMENLWETGSLVINQTDGFLKTPFYNLLLFPLQPFGNLMIFRMVCLVIAMVGFGILFNSLKAKSFVFTAFVFCIAMQSTLFMHLHLAMAEIFVLSFVCLAIASITKERYFTWAFCCLLAAVMCKIQYVYLLLLVFPIIIYQIKNQTVTLKKWILPFALLIIFVVFYFSQRTGYQYIIEHQQVGKFQNFGNWIFRAKVNLTHLIQDHFTLGMFILFTLVIFFLVYYYLKTKIAPSFLLIFIVLAWLLESHKLLYIYLPQRYLVLWFALMGLIILCGVSIGIAYLKINRKVMIPIGCLLIAIGSLQYVRLYKKRSFEMCALRHEMMSKLPKNASVTGPWAPSLFFGSKVVATTAWGNYYENQEIWNKSGAYIVAEKNQADVDSLFSKQLKPHLQLVPISSGKVKKWEIGLWRVEEK